MNRRFAIRTFGALTAIALASCFGDSTGPGAFRVARLSVAPQVDGRALLVVDVARVRIRLFRGGGATAADTVIEFPPGADSIAVGVEVPVQGASETFDLLMQLIGPAGDTVFQAGPIPVVARPGLIGPPTVAPPFRYVGVGANAASVRFVQPPASLFFGDSALFVAEAVDSGGQVIPNTPILFSSGDTIRARVPDPRVGRVVAGQQRGTVQIRADLLTPVFATTPLAIQPRPVAIGVVSGSGQTGGAGTALPQPVVVRVKGADSLGVQGVAVTFNVIAGGGVLSQMVDTTDANGDAAVTWTLGAPIGTQTITAAAAGVATPVLVSATAIPGAPQRLVFQVEPGDGQAAVALAPPPTVAVQDAFGNVVTSFAGTVSVALGANPGAATLSGTTSVAAAAGVATFADLRLDRAGTGYTLVATSGALVPDTSVAFSITGGTPARLVVVQEPTTVAAGAPIAPAMRVEVQDVNGNLVASATDVVAVAIASNPGGSTLAGVLSRAAVAGVATFDSVRLDRAGAGYTLAFASGTLTPDTTVAFTVTAGAPAAIALASGSGQTDTVRATLAQPLVVQVTDAFGNGVAGDTVRFQATGGGSVADSVAVTGAGGQAQTAWTLGPTAGAQAASATRTGLAGSPVAFAATATPATAAQLVFTSQPTGTTAGAAITPPPAVTVRDNFGNTATSFAGSVTLALGANPSGATLSGTATVAASAGVAAFPGLSLDRTGAGYTLVATSGVLPSATSATFDIEAGAPHSLVFTTEPPASVAAGTPFALVVTARDSLGNTAASYAGSITLLLANNPGGATLGGTTTAGATGGVASFSGLTLDRIGAGYTLEATASGLIADTSGSVTVTSAPAATLALVSGSGQTGTVGTALAQPLVVWVTDAFSNPVAGDTVRFAASAGAVADSVVLTDGAGQAQTTWTLGTTAGAQSATATRAGLAGSPVPFAATANPGAAVALTFSTSPLTTVAGEVLAPSPTVTARDAFGNVATGFAGTVTTTLATNPGSATLSGTTAVNATAGVATFADLRVNVAAVGYQLGAGASGVASAISASFDILGGAPSQLVFTTQPPASVTAGAGFGLVVAARDSLGNTAAGFTGGVTLTIGTNPGGATLGGTTALNAVAGLATFGNLTLDRIGAGYTLQAAASGVPTATSSAITVTAAAPAAIALVSGDGQSDTVAATLAQPLVVRVTDALGNPVAGDTVTFAAGGGSVGVPTAVTDAAGQAQTTWTLGTTAGAQSATATRAGLSGSPVTFSATATAGTTTQLVFTAPPPDTVTAGAAFGVTVTARDAFGNTATGFTDSLFLSVAGPDTLGGTRRLAMAGGTAATNDLTLQVAGSGYTLTALASPSALNVTSGAFTVRPAGAAVLAVVSGSGQADTVAATLGQPLVVRVTDALGNPIAGDTVTFATGTGSVGSPTAVTDAAGQAQTTWTLGTSAGEQTATATRAGLSGSPATFTATATHGTPYRLAFTGQPSDVVAGDTIAPPVTVAVQDGFGNTATGFSDTVVVTVSLNQDVVLFGNRFRTATAGVVSYDDLSVRNAFSYRLVAFAPGLLSDSSAVFTVGAGAAQALVLYAGDGQTQNVGAALPFPLQVRAVDQFNNGAPGVTVSWSTSDGSLPPTSVTDAQGVASATWTLGLTVGTQTALASVAGLSGSPVTFTATGVPAGVGVLWTGANGTSWDDPANWSTAARPTTADTVWIPASATNQPEVFQSDSVGGLLVESGATVTLADNTVALKVMGGVDAAFTSISGPGVLVAANPGATALPVRGSFSRLRITGRYVVQDSVITSDSLVIGDGGQFDVTGIVRVGGSFLMDSTGTGGRLLMDAPAGVLDVAGSATFASPLPMLLTAGTLRLAGDLVQIQPTGGNQNNFAATNGHTTVFQGGGSQRLRLETPMPGTGSRLGNVTVSIGDGNLILDGALGGVLVALEGSLDVQQGGVGDTLPLLVDGNVNLAASTSLTLNQLTVRGALSVDPAASYTVALTQFSGLGQTIPALPYQTVSVTGTATLGADVTASAVFVQQNGAALTVGGHVMTVNGPLQVGSVAGNVGGVLVMTDPADSVDVWTAVFGGQDTSGVLNAGTLVVRNLFHQDARDGGRSFVATGTHTTVMQSSEVGVTLLMESGGSAASQLRDLRTLGTSTDPVHLGPGRTYVSGELRAATTVDGPGTDTLTVAGPAEFAGWDLTLNRLELGDSLIRSGPFYNVGTTAFFGTLQRPPVLAYGNLEILGTAALSAGVSDASGYLHVLGPGAVLTIGDTAVISVVGETRIRGGQLNLLGDGRLYAVNGFATDSGGRLSQAGTSQLVVQAGETRFEGGSTAGLMTAGLLELRGGFLQGGHPQSFAPSGSHVTRIAGGGGVQDVRFTDPDSTASHFRHLRILTPQDTVALRTAAWVTGDVFMADSLTGGDFPVILGGDGGMNVQGNFTMVTSLGLPVTVVPRRLRLYGFLSDVGSGTSLFRPDTVVFAGSGQQIPTSGAYQYQSLVVEDSIVADFGVTIQTAGDFIVRGSGVFTFSDAMTVNVGGTFRSEGAGRATMAFSSARLAVANGASFRGGNTVFSDGQLALDGGGFEQAVNPTAFRAFAPHTTYLSLDQPFDLSLEHPDTALAGTGSHFGDLQLSSSGVTASLLSDVALDGRLVAGDIGSATIDGAHALFARGANFSYFGLTVDASRVVFLDGAAVDFNGVTFQDQPPEADQLVLRRSDALLTLSDLTFSQVPTTGHYVWVDKQGAGDQTVEFQSPTPSSAGPYVRRTGTPLPTVIWDGEALPSARRWASAVSGDWNSGGNWVGGLAPFPADTAIIDVPGSYVVTLSAPDTVGAVQLSEGILDIGGQRLDVAGDFTVTGAAGLKMSFDGDTLRVDGTATFAGTAVDTLLRRGFLILRGNFVQQQTGAANNFFALADHKTIFEGGGPQSVTFGSPGESGSRFGELRVQKSADSLTLLSAATVGVSFSAGAGQVIGGPGTLEVGGVFSTSGNAIVRPRRVRITGSFSPSPLGLFSPDTVEFTTGTVRERPGMDFRHVVVTDTVTLDSVMTLSGDLVIAGPEGRADLAGGAVVTVQKLRTLGVGTLGMDALFPSPATLVILDSAVFGGGRDTMTAGLLELRGALVQSDASHPASFRSQGGHRVVFAGAADAPVMFATPDSSFFGHVAVNRSFPGAVRLASRATVTDSLVVEGRYLALNGHRMDVLGHFSARSSGWLQMLSAADTLTVAGSTRFSATQPAGELSAGVLRVAGGLRAFNASQEFHAGPSHVTEFVGTDSQQVELNNPGFGLGQSRFGTMRVLNTSARGLRLLSNLAAEVLEDGPGSNRITSTSITAERVTTRGVSVNGMVFDSVALVVDTGGAGGASLTDVEFRNQEERSDAMLTVTRPFTSGTIAIDQVRFDSLTAATRRYVRATQVGGGTAGDFTLRLTNAGPLSPGDRWQTIGGAAIDWNGDILSNVVSWIGPTTGTQSWKDPANWSTNALPTDSQTVVITGDGAWTITLDTTATVKGLQLGDGVTIPTLQLSSGAQLRLLDSSTVASNAVLEITGGSLVTDTVLAVAGTLTWTGGTMTGGGRLHLRTGAFSSVQGNGSVALDAFRIVNDGEMYWTDDVTINGSNGAHLDNRLTFQLQGTGDWVHGAGAADTISNLGAWTQAATAGPNSLDAVVYNASTMEILGAGTLTVGRTFRNLGTGTLTVAAGSILETTSSSVVLDAGGPVFGGTLRSASAFVIADGDLHPGSGAATGQMTLTSVDTTALGASAELFIRLAGTTPITQYDQLTSANPLNVGGTITITLEGGFNPSLGDQFDVVTCPAGGCNVNNFAAVNLPGLPGGLIWQWDYQPTFVRLRVDTP